MDEPRPRRSPVSGLLRLLIRGYQRAPRTGGPRCRFAPTCSTYAYQAIELHGALRGLGLATRRVSRCHPFNPGGLDPVPTDDAARAHGAPSGAVDAKEPIT